MGKKLRKIDIFNSDTFTGIVRAITVYAVYRRYDSLFTSESAFILEKMFLSQTGYPKLAVREWGSTSLSMRPGMKIRRILVHIFM
jgi:hypothetical protein